MNVAIPDEGELGPAMKALASDRQRAFVLALVASGGGSGKVSAAYREAGYSGDAETVRPAAHRLLHDDRIQDALREESFKRLGAAAMSATSLLVEIMESDSPSIKPSHKLKAAGMIMNRTGLHETTEHKVTVEKKMNEGEKVDRIIALAKTLGVDPKTLLGRAGYSLPDALQQSGPEIDATVEDAEFEEVGSTKGLEDLL